MGHLIVTTKAKLKLIKNDALICQCDRELLHIFNISLPSYSLSKSGVLEKTYSSHVQSRIDYINDVKLNRIKQIK